MTLAKFTGELNDATATAITHIQAIMEEQPKPVHSDTPKVSEPIQTNRNPLFPKVDLQSFKDFTPRNPYRGEAHRPTDISEATGINLRDPSVSPQRSHVNYTPGVDHHTGSQYQQDGAIPSLQYDNIMKRTQVQYTGEQDILVFYNQLMNGVAPYGLYLIPKKEFELTKSLCPDTYGGNRITNERYRSMAGCLYQKLASFDTIPAEFTDARNVINQYAESNDGYKVLYSLIEPLLQTDEVLTTPNDSEWRNIHEYAIKFQSYVNSEALKGPNFTPKEQTKLFLNGLSGGWESAIRRARVLMDNGGPADPTVPAVLKIPKLAKTMERWLKEETGQSVVRVAYNPVKCPSVDHKGRYKSHHSTAHQPGDKGMLKICGICLSTNHHKS